MSRAVVLSLGSNLGERRYQLARALHLLRSHVRLVRISGIFETEPVDAPAGSQPFLNLVAVGLCALSPQDLLVATQAIERRLGRRRAVRNAPRPIDIDVVLFEGVQLRTPSLTLPHPRFRERNFVLDPLRQIAPAWNDSSGVPLESLRGSGFTREVDSSAFRARSRR